MEKKEYQILNIDQTHYQTRLSRKFAQRKPYAAAEHGKISSFIPGTVVEVLVKVGDTVAEGDDLIILDAMKMKNRLKTHIQGRVISINVKPGDRVSKGVMLAEIG